MKPLTPKEGPITKALHEAVAMRKQLIADGMPAAQADTTVGHGLKALLGNKRAEPWRFYCEACHDSGWVEVAPDLERMRRLYGTVGEPWQPTYRACEPCAWRTRQRKQRQTVDEDDFTTSRTAKPSRGFSKVGAR